MHMYVPRVRQIRKAGIKLAIHRLIPRYQAYPCMYRFPIILCGQVRVYSSMWLGTYTNIRVATTTAKGIILSMWGRVGVTIGTFIISLCGDTYISYRVYICVGANILLCYMLHLSLHFMCVSMCVYVLYIYVCIIYIICKYIHTHICGQRALINRCIYELLFKCGKEKQQYLEFKWAPKIKKRHSNV
jgi:hypothetical protein